MPNWGHYSTCRLCKWQEKIINLFSMSHWAWYIYAQSYCKIRSKCVNVCWQLFLGMYKADKYVYRGEPPNCVGVFGLTCLYTVEFSSWSEIFLLQWSVCCHLLYVLNCLNSTFTLHCMYMYGICELFSCRSLRVLMSAWETQIESAASYAVWLLMAVSDCRFDQSPH